MFSGSITLVIALLLVRLRQQRYDRFARIDGLRFVDDRLFAGIDLDQTADRVSPKVLTKSSTTFSSNSVTLFLWIRNNA